jgi:alkyl hydroperoxide reductase 1
MKLFMSDEGVPFSSSLGWTNGTKPLRYIIIVDHGKIVYADKDVPKSVAITGAPNALAHL